MKVTPRMGNQMEKKVDNDTESGSMLWFIGVRDT